MTARVTNGVYVRLNPSRDANASFTRCRVRTTCSMLTSTMFHARAVVWSDPTMCEAISFRMCVIGTVSSPPPETTGPGTARNAGAEEAAGAEAAAAAGADVPPAATASITSFFVIRPPVPLPVIWERSR